MLADEQQLMTSDPKFRSYAGLVDKALKGFEYTNEWADLISALAKLTKVIGSHRSYTLIPKKITIGKRLAQCLHPALPAGVHLKALELYETIFSSISAENLAKDFAIYSTGLLPLTSHATMAVKPVLLRLYESHILPVGPQLMSAASGILLGLLPGLEEGSEFFDMTNSLCEKFCETFGAEHYYTNLWSCMLTCPSIRLPGTMYILNHIDKNRNMEDQLFILGSSISQLVSSLKSCLEDTLVLVQRNTLDILSLAFPFHSSQLTRYDQSEVVESAVLVLLRRDMSLNRRLYAWLLGITTTGTKMIAKQKMDLGRKSSVEDTVGRQRHDSGSSSASEPELEYFNLYSKKYLVQSLNKCLGSASSGDMDVIRPIRLLISLLDRVDIGSVVLEDILISVFQLLRHFYDAHIGKTLASNKDLSTYHIADYLAIDFYRETQVNTKILPLSTKVLSELLKTYNLLFGTLDPPFLWEFLADTYEKVLWPSEVRTGHTLNMAEFCDIVSMVISIVPLESYSETQTVYLPRLLYNILNLLKHNIDNVGLSDVLQVLQLSRHINHIVLPASNKQDETGQQEVLSVHDCLPVLQDLIEKIMQLQHRYDIDKDVDDTADVDANTNVTSVLLCASVLYLEVSSFPVYVSRMEDQISRHAVCSENEAPKLPSWLQFVVYAAKGKTVLPLSCQQIATSLLLDLIRLSELSYESQTFGERSQSARSEHSELASGSLDVISVTIKPSITSSMCLELRNELNMLFLHIWSSLDIDDCHKLKISSFLLAKILSSTNQCRSMQNYMIGDLLSKNVDKKIVAYKKFSCFWHLTRDLRLHPDKINIVLMVVLSCYVRETELIQELVSNWIIHSVHCGDVNRLIEPLLIQLLDSDSTRISVQEKFKVEKQQTGKTEDADIGKSLESAQRRIKAIGSDGKLVMVKNDGNKPGKATQKAGVIRQSVVSEDGLITHSDYNDEPMDFENVANCGRIGLAMNPFGNFSDLDRLIFDGFVPHEALKTKWDCTEERSQESYHSIISRAKRLDREICKKEGIVFSDAQISNVEETSAKYTNDTGEKSHDVIPLGPPGGAPISYPQPPPLTDPNIVEFVNELIDGLIDDVMKSQQLENVTSADDARQPVTRETSSTSFSESESNICNENNSKLTKETPQPVLGSHAYILLYDQCYDVYKVDFIFTLLKNVLQVNPVLIVSNLTSSSCSSTTLLELIVRHNKSLKGGNFYGSVNQEDILGLRSVRLLEVIITICTYYWRSYHSASHPNDKCIYQNSYVQLKAIDMLMALTHHVGVMLVNSPKGFPQYMADVFQRCKVQKTCVFHLQSLYNRTSSQLSEIGAAHDIRADIPMLTRILKLTKDVVCLESSLQLVHDVQNSHNKGNVQVLFRNALFTHPNIITSLTKSLLDSQQNTIHHHWLALIANCIGSVHTTLQTAEVIIRTISETCLLFERISRGLTNTKSDQQMLPPDYIPQLLEHFTTICHFYFMDTANHTARQSDTDHARPSNTGQILSNLVSVFNPLNLTSSKSDGTELERPSSTDAELSSPKSITRDQLLSRLPKILSSISLLWRVHKALEDMRVVQQIVEFLSPILHNYAEQLLGSVAVVWSDCQDELTSKLTQETLVSLLLSIKALPIEVIVYKLSSVIKQPPDTDHTNNTKDTYKWCNWNDWFKDQAVLQMSCLRFLRGYISKINTIPRSCLHSVCSLLKQCLQLNLPPVGILLLLELVNEFVFKFGNIGDKKILKEMQDIVGKVLDACCEIVATQLEASTWTIRKNYTLKTRSQTPECDEQLTNMPGIRVDDSETSIQHEPEVTRTTLSLLADMTASLLDVVYPSEDKDKIVPILTNMLTKIFPYLRNHSLLNMSCYRASSKLVSSISSYQYTRKTWKREIYDLLLLPNFFQMDVSSLQYWKILIDNLVTHDKTMFKDLLAKFSILGTSTLPIFSTRDSELIARAHNLKKLSFVIYSGDVDHYKHYMPEIQERLAENLRLTQSPTVLSQVFLTFRVLLLRMTSSSLVLLWPTIITELVHVMTQIDEELSLTDEDEGQLSRVSEIDGLSGLNGSNVHHTCDWLNLYLSACKLLELLLVLPNDIVPEFQHYIWMFTGSDEAAAVNSLQTHNEAYHSTGYKAHIPEILRKMSHKFGIYKCNRSMGSRVLYLGEQKFTVIKDLQPFFSKVMQSDTSTTMSTKSVVNEAEAVLDYDIVETLT